VRKQEGKNAWMSRGPKEGTIEKAQGQMGEGEKT
jgi:hypothetical protein